jgi:hypothetical protein
MRFEEGPNLSESRSERYLDSIRPEYAFGEQPSLSVREVAEPDNEQETPLFEDQNRQIVKDG